jgi:hypothetical protein
MQIKNYTRFHLTPVRIKSLRKQTTTNAGENAGKEEYSYTVDANVN